jgi:biotin/methionine sulfoxide reductase
MALRDGNEIALGHWGMSEVARHSDGTMSLRNWTGDPDPSMIGLDQLSPEVDACRVLRPSFRRGWLEKGPGVTSRDRGNDSFVELPWDEAIDILSSELSRIIRENGNKAIFGGSYGWGSAGRFHHAQSQVHRFLKTIGGYVGARDSYSFGAGSVIMPHIVAPMERLLEDHTDWNTLAENTKLFVAFGGLPLRNTQMTAGGPSQHRLRNALEKMAENGCRFVNVGPLSQDVHIDAEWVPIRPNTDVALMLALCHVLVANDLHDRTFLDEYCVGFAAVADYLFGRTDGIEKNPTWAEQITGIPRERITALAREMAASMTMVNASWSLQRQSHGEQPYWSLVTLASLIGQIGTSGGGFGIGYGTLNSVGSNESGMSGPKFPQGENQVKEFVPVARIADMLLHPGASFEYNGRTYQYPDIKAIYWAGGNPFHHHQDLNRFLGAWRKPETIIIHDQFWTSSAKAADIVLPVSTALERDDIGYASREGHVVAMRQLRVPLGDAKSDFDIFADIAAAMGKGEAFTEGLTSGGWLRRMFSEYRVRMQNAVELPEFDEFWQMGRVELSSARKPNVMLSLFRKDPEAFPLKTPSGKIELHSNTIAGFGIADCPGQASWIEPFEWLGSEKAERFPLHLLSQEPSRRLHSQLDHAPHSRAAKIKGREPVLIGDVDAEQRGIADGDVVRIFNSRGSCLAGAKITEGLLQGVVVLATGAWFDPISWGGGQSLEKHGNPNVLTADIPASGLSQATTAQTCLVEIELFEGDLPAITAFQPPSFVSIDRDHSSPEATS